MYIAMERQGRYSGGGGDYSGNRKEEGDKGGNARNLNTKIHLRGHMAHTTVDAC